MKNREEGAGAENFLTSVMKGILGMRAIRHVEAVCPAEPKVGFFFEHVLWGFWTAGGFAREDARGRRRCRSQNHIMGVFVAYFFLLAADSIFIIQRNERCLFLMH